ncbi:MAG: hypothetical protein U0T82_13510 [Bacteroidales bacterium]
MKEEEEGDELRRKIPGENPMGVPSGYFDTFASRLQDRLNAEVRHPAPARPLAWIPARLVPALAVAGVVLIATLFTIRWFLSPELVIPQAQVSELIEFSSYNFDEDQLIEVLENNADSTQSSLEDARIMDYLSTQEIDFTDASIDL